MGIVLQEPSVDVEVVELLAPEHPRQRLAHDHGVIGADRGGVMAS